LLRESSPSLASEPSTNTPSPVPSGSPNASPSLPAPETDTHKKQYGKIGERPFAVFDSDAKTSTPFERWIEGRAKEKMGEHGTKMGLFIATLLSNLPYMMLCCIPLFALVLKVLYIRRHIFYIDHLVYAFHVHSFAYLIIMLNVLITIGLHRTIPGIFANWIVATLWVVFGIQIFMSIRRVYRQGWFFSVFKFFVGGFVNLMVLGVALF